MRKWLLLAALLLPMLWAAGSWAVNQRAIGAAGCLRLHRQQSQQGQASQNPKQQARRRRQRRKGENLRHVFCLNEGFSKAASVTQFTHALTPPCLPAQLCCLRRVRSKSALGKIAAMHHFLHTKG